MSGPPPPPPSGPLWSPDGRHYWDGARWVPAPTPRPPMPLATTRPSNAGCSIAAVMAVIAVVLVIGLIWYFVFYDTAAGKCNRGDLGACLVVAGQHAAVQASAAASEAAVAASATAAVQQQRENERARLNTAMLSGCTVVWDPNHNMRVTYIDSSRDANCSAAKGQGWTAADRVPGSSIVCANSALVVEDTGGRALGTDLCTQLQLNIWPQP